VVLGQRHIPFTKSTTGRFFCFFFHRNSATREAGR
jgi:hypothetical protein